MGMGMGANQGMMGQNPMLGMQGMASYGQAWRNLGYDYTPPSLGYKPETTWGAWDLANAQYNGGRLERSFFDNITLGGAAAYQAYLIWDRDHYSAYHAMPSQENRERLIGLAVAELFSLWDRVQPRSTRATTEEAAQYAAATAKYLFDRHYDLPHNPHAYHRTGSRFSNYRRDDSDSEDEHHLRRRSMYGQPYTGMQAAPGLDAGGMMNGMNGMMPGGMPGQGMGMGMGIQPGMMGGMQGMGMGQMGMPGMQGMGPMGGMGMQPGMMGQMGQMGIGGMGMGQMGGMGMMQPGMMGLQQGVPPHGSIGESQAAPVGHRHCHLFPLSSILRKAYNEKKKQYPGIYTDT
ncbi:hypothetical protein I315_04493 [Cryptococcus gattii Ru294]|nr:hypothetical protein I315_04493 [Cryptococcus gattii Ru294]